MSIERDGTVSYFGGGASSIGVEGKSELSDPLCSDSNDCSSVEVLGVDPVGSLPVVACLPVGYLVSGGRVGITTTGVENANRIIIINLEEPVPNEQTERGAGLCGGLS